MSGIIFDGKHFLLCTIPAIFIILAESLTTWLSTKKDDKHNQPWLVLSYVMYAVAWFVVCTVLVHGKMDSIGLVAGVIISSIIVVVSSILLKYYLQKKDFDKQVFTSMPYLLIPTGFILAWIALGWLVGDNTITKAIGILGALCIILSAYSLYYQRSTCLIEGPGMVLVTLGWILIAFAHALEFKSDAHYLKDLSNTRPIPTRTTPDFAYKNTLPNNVVKNTSMRA